MGRDLGRGADPRRPAGRDRVSDYRDLNGLKSPATFVQTPRRLADLRGAAARGAGQSRRPRRQARRPARRRSPPRRRRPPAPRPRPPSEQLAPGVWRIRGAYNALAVEIRRPRRAVRARPPERGPRQGDHRRDQARDPRQADPLRCDLAPPLRPHRRPAPRWSPRASPSSRPRSTRPSSSRALGAPRTLAPDAVATSGKKAARRGLHRRQARVRGRHAAGSRST